MAGLLGSYKKGDKLGSYRQGGGLLDIAIQNPEEAAKTLLGFTPIVGDAMSVYDGIEAAKKGDMLGAGLGALGALPFIPNITSSAGKVAKAVSKEGPRAEAMRIAQANAAKPVSEGGLGLRPDNTPMERAKALGFDTPAYHGTRNAEPITSFDPWGNHGAARSGDAYGVGTYTSTDPSTASLSAYTGETGAVMPLLINRGNHLNLDAPSSSDLEKLSKFAGDQMLPSDKARFEIGRKDRFFADDKEAEDFFKSQLANWKQFGDGMNRAKPHAEFTKDGVNVSFTDFDAPVPITSGKDAETLLKAVGWDNVPSMGFAGHTMKRNSGEFWDVTTDSSKLRSRFAAFDPARRHEADLLGFADPRLLALIAAGTGGGLLATKE